MGQDDLAVVDAQLRVHGIAALRMIEASIMPTVTDSNTNAPTIMIAEKGARLKDARQLGLSRPMARSRAPPNWESLSHPN
jgi:choline dehydrogenase-like flavoprotein